MAEIQVERKQRSHAGLLLGLLLLVALLGAGWYFTMGPGAGAPVDGPDAAQEPPVSTPGPQAPLPPPSAVPETGPAPGMPGTAPAPTGP